MRIALLSLKQIAEQQHVPERTKRTFLSLYEQKDCCIGQCMQCTVMSTAFIGHLACKCIATLLPENVVLLNLACHVGSATRQQHMIALWVSSCFGECTIPSCPNWLIVFLSFAFKPPFHLSFAVCSRLNDMTSKKLEPDFQGTLVSMEAFVPASL